MSPSLRVLFSFPIWAPYAMGCTAAFYGVAGMLVFFNVVWALAIFFTAYYVYFLWRGMDVDYKLQYPADAPCWHIIILTIYKDDMEVRSDQTRSKPKPKFDSTRRANDGALT